MDRSPSEQTKYNRIYVLGSGFSKAISSGMPAINELTEMLRSMGKKGTDLKYPQLAHFVQEMAKKTVSSDELTSIESISSLILGKEIFYNNDVYLYYHILQNQLFHWLHEKIDNFAHTVDIDKQELVLDFIKKCTHSTNTKDREHSLVITFNYDLLLERLFTQLDPSEYFLNYIVKLNRYFDSAKNPTGQKNIFEYLKLHGSFNWFRSPGSQVYDINNIYRVNDDDKERDLIHHDDIPIFIPMTYSKGGYLIGSFYNALWNIAERYLTTAEEINFIGYGFPATDINNIEFFLRFKDKIKDIVIKEDLPEKITRLENLFGREKILNIDAVEYISNK